MNGISFPLAYLDLESSYSSNVSRIRKLALLTRINIQNAFRHSKFPGVTKIPIYVSAFEKI